jgi:hypothetical protein
MCALNPPGLLDRPEPKNCDGIREYLQNSTRDTRPCAHLENQIVSPDEIIPP